MPETKDKSYMEKIEVRNEDHFRKVKEFARNNGLLEQLEDRLQFLADYSPDWETKCVLAPDFAPYSFYFNMMRRDTPESEWQFWFGGGLIFFQGSGWSIHT